MKTFSQVFNANMKSMGLPVPGSMFGAVATTLGTVGALAGAVAKVGASATVSEILLTVPVAAGSTVTAAAVTEIVAVCGGVTASFYVGACIGSVIIAAYETLDVNDLVTVILWLKDVAASLGESMDKFLEMVVADNGRASPVRSSITLAKITA